MSIALPASVQSRPSAYRIAGLLLTASLLLACVGLAAGSEGRSLDWQSDWDLIRTIRAPRTLGAFAAGALLAGSTAAGKWGGDAITSLPPSDTIADR